MFFMKRLLDLKPLEVPTFLEGDSEFVKEFFRVYEQAREGRTGLDISRGGSSPLITGLVNKVLEGTGYRTPVPTDNVCEEIFPLITRKRYDTDLNVLDVPQSVSRYAPLWQQAHKLAEDYLKTKPLGTFRIQGFYYTPSEGLSPAPNFRVIQSDILDIVAGASFDSLDENGLVVPFPGGKFEWSKDGKGLMGMHLVPGGAILSHEKLGMGDPDLERVLIVNC